MCGLEAVAQPLEERPVLRFLASGDKDARRFDVTIGAYYIDTLEVSATCWPGETCVYEKSSGQSLV
jgi:hypothetical protein